MLALGLKGATALNVLRALVEDQSWEFLFVIEQQSLTAVHDELMPICGNQLVLEVSLMIDQS